MSHSVRREEHTWMVVCPTFGEWNPTVDNKRWQRKGWCYSPCPTMEGLLNGPRGAFGGALNVVPLLSTRCAQWHVCQSSFLGPTSLRGFPAVRLLLIGQRLCKKWDDNGVGGLDPRTAAQYLLRFDRSSFVLLLNSKTEKKRREEVGGRVGDVKSEVCRGPFE